MKYLLALLLLIGSPAWAQHIRQPSQMSIDGTWTFATLPTASTYPGYTAYTSDQGPVYSNGTVWAAIGGGSVPATIGSNTVIGNATNATAAPQQLSVGSCSTSASALKWTTNTGFGCNTAIDAATLLTGTWAAPGAIGSGTPAAGNFTTLGATGLITPSTTNGILGTATADNANAGSVGEFFSVNCPAPTSATVSFTNASPTVMTWASHPWAAVGAANWTCGVNFTGSVPTGISVGTNYYLIGSTCSADSCQLSDTAAHALAGTNAINTSSTGTTPTGFIGSLMATATAYAGASMLISAGDWDCSGTSEYGNVSSLTTTGFYAGINTATSLVLPYTQTRTSSVSISTNSADLPTPIYRENVSIQSTIVLVDFANFSGGSQNAGGFLRCRRMR